LSGWTLGVLRQDGKDIDITLRQHQSVPNETAMSEVQVPVSGMGLVPLTNLGNYVVKPNLAQIARSDFTHQVEITASVQAGYSSVVINQQLAEFVDNQLQLPPDYRRSTGGNSEMNQEAMQGIYVAMAVALGLIVFTLVLQLNSFRKAFIVVSVIPVAISGVFFGFAFLGLSLTLPAFIGILALFGIVVNNSILIVERINQNLSEGKQFLAAVTNGCASRLQPILLTSLTTIIGLIPITFSNPLWQGLGAAIIAGLTFSGILLLLYIPALYVIMFDPDRLQQKEEKWQQWKNRWQ
jgi:multidrug efflux pump subunit AcrB